MLVPALRVSLSVLGGCGESPALNLVFALLRGVRMDIGIHVSSLTLIDHAFKEVQLPIPGKCTVIAFFPAAFSGTAVVGCECQLTVSALKCTDVMSNRVQLTILHDVIFAIHHIQLIN
jgi:hypothetical protein